MRITITTAPGRTAQALIVHELPEIGGLLEGHTVAALEPRPLYVPQPVPDVYRYAVWLASFTDCTEKMHLAIHEADAEKI